MNAFVIVTAEWYIHPYDLGGLFHIHRLSLLVSSSAVGGDFSRQASRCLSLCVYRVHLSALQSSWP